MILSKRSSEEVHFYDQGSSDEMKLIYHYLQYLVELFIVLPVGCRAVATAADDGTISSSPYLSVHDPLL